MITVRVFASLRELLGREEVDLDLPEDASVACVFDELQKMHPKIASYRSSLLTAVNQEYCDWEEKVGEGDEVAFFPPVSGGSPDPQGSAKVKGIVEIIEAAIDPMSVMRSVSSPRAGAVVTFDGVVRDHARGKEVSHLFYETYSEMALKEIIKIRDQALSRWELHGAAIVHRVGRLRIGESSVFIAVSSSHRAQAFEACRFIIDTLKTTVPIWKKEHYQDGEVWIEEYS